MKFRWYVSNVLRIRVTSRLVMLQNCFRKASVIGWIVEAFFGLK